MLPNPVALQPRTQMPLVTRDPWSVLVARAESSEADGDDAVDRILTEANVARSLAPRGLILPASHLVASSLSTLTQRARNAVRVAELHGVDVVFGGEVAPLDEWAPLRPAAEQYLYAFCDGQWRINGAPQLAVARRLRPERLRERVCYLAGRQVCVLLAPEVFLRGLGESVTDLGVEVVIVLSRHAPTPRWTSALALLRSRAPTVVVNRSARPLLCDHTTRAWDRARRVEIPGLHVDELHLIEAP